MAKHHHDVINDLVFKDTVEPADILRSLAEVTDALSEELEAAAEDAQDGRPGKARKLGYSDHAYDIKQMNNLALRYKSQASHMRKAFRSIA